MDTIDNVRKHIVAYYTAYFNAYGATIEGAAWGSGRERLHTRWRHVCEVFRLDPCGIVTQPTVRE